MSEGRPVTMAAARRPSPAPMAAGVTLAVLGAVGLAGLVGTRDGGPGGVGGGDPVARFLLAVVVVLVVCHGCGALLRRLGQPSVVGEILGGLLLGPSILGAVWPSGTRWLFPVEVLGHLDRAAQLGLVVFVFLLGCQLRTHIGSVGRAGVLVPVVAGSVGLPLLAGVVVAVAGAGVLAAGGTISVRYVLFVGVALSITALPVLGRILLDRGLANTTVGALAVTAAAVGDGIAWVALALLLAATGPATATGWAAAVVLGGAVALGAVLGLRPALAALEHHISRPADGRVNRRGGRPLSRWRGGRDGGRDGGEPVLLAVLVVGAVGCAAITELIGLHPLLGAFLFGLAVARYPRLRRQATRGLQPFTVGVLLPLFFAGVGLTTFIGLLGTTSAHWLVLVLVLVAAVGSKVAGAGGAALLAGLPRRDALRLGVLMNCRGVTELVAATIGLHHGLIGPLGFTILVLVAVLTTATTGPLLQLTRRRFSRPWHGYASVGRPV